MEDSGRTLKVKIPASRQFLTVDGWEDIVHDRALKIAHDQGAIPIGPSVVEVEEQEGLDFGRTRIGQLAPDGSEVVVVIVTMMLGTD